MNTQQKAKILREAGQVQRAHTIPHQGGYSNAEHVHNMLDLLFLLYPGDPSLSLIKAIQFHDVAERWVGDMPGPGKYSTDRMTTAIEFTELDCLACVDLPHLDGLTVEETQWLHGLDKVELYLWAADQVALGNKNAEPVLLALKTSFFTNEYALPLELSTFVDSFEWSRTSDFPPLEK